MLFPTEQLLKMSVMDQNMHKFSCPGFESLMRRDLFMTAWFRSQPSFLSGENWICWYWLHWIACAIRSRKCMPNTMPSVYYSGKEIGSFLKCVTYQTYNSIITLSLNTLYRPYFLHTYKQTILCSVYLPKHLGTILWTVWLYVQWAYKSLYCL